MAFSHFPGYSAVVGALLLATFLVAAVDQAGCFSFTYSTFEKANESDLTTNNSYIVFGAIQVTPDVSSGALIENQSGRALFKRPFRLRSNMSFRSTFVLNISNKTNPGGEGLAFILTGSTDLPPSSHGQWLGIVNQTTNGSAEAQIVAVEFDTRKSYPEDLDDNHVGLNVNSINSITQKSLSLKLSNEIGKNVTVKVEYDGGVLRVFVEENASTPVISETIDLSKYLPEKIYVGFSASTGIQTELNCVKSWEFGGLDIYEEKSLVWVWITVPIVVFLAVTIPLLYWRCTREDEGRVEDGDDPEVELQIQGSSMAPKRFRLKELQAATANFNSKNQLGEGGFGKVYKGVLEKKEVAVKRFSKNSHQGKQDFIAEVTTIGNLHHKNLVKLVGWCYERSELLLVYEFMPNKSLDKLIFSNQKQSTETNPIVLDWEKRHSIIRGVAQALDYLHNGCQDRVLHRDIKTSNIMLDSEFNARLGDFGLARTIHPNDQTHHSTQVLAGTHGYMAPESFHNSRATVETDVYAFGVLLLEVVCARKPGTQSMENDYNNSIVDWVWAHHRRDRLFEVVDFRLNGDFNREQVECVLMLALACCHPNPYERPSMRTALRVITGEVDPPLIPFDKPVFMWPATAPPSFNEDLEYCSVSGGQMTPLSELSGR
ncbi:probable L-type lectin-domain containing receptor kinase S.5 [Vitis riparia]|uniref:probable L-type lectin-domain containing receptor kinase S.5 n=1 Tax=Vitis riparia TaxID=96939 RepID=UPI00155B0866|nr:probable L-type lectin-domain containing receptor kinase S.5 [Vitis riparia]